MFISLLGNRPYSEPVWAMTALSRRASAPAPGRALPQGWTVHPDFIIVETVLQGCGRDVHGRIREIEEFYFHGFYSKDLLCEVSRYFFS